MKYINLYSPTSGNKSNKTQTIKQQKQNHVNQIIETAESVLKPRLHDTTCCQTRCQAGCTTRFDNRWTNSCSFKTVVKQPVWQPVGCLFTRYSRLSNRLYNRFYKLYRVNGVLASRLVTVARRPRIASAIAEDCYVFARFFDVPGPIFVKLCLTTRYGLKYFMSYMVVHTCL